MGTWNITAIIAAIITASAVGTAAGPEPTPCTRRDEPRRLRIYCARGLPDGVITQAQREVEAIWRRHAIAIEWVNGRIGPPTSSDLIVSVADRPVGKPHARHAIAWILFMDGEPTHYIQVSLRAAVAVLDSRSAWDGLPGAPWQTGLREVALGRIIGRSLAHEIGHYLLGSTRHASSGLMRAILPNEELITPGRAKLSLPASDARAIQAARPLRLVDLQSIAAVPPEIARCK